MKQETPWAVPESPPPVNDDPSVWKPKANTGTEIWEKNTGHRTQPWQNQGPNTPRWMSDDHETPSSVWPAPSNAQIPGPLSGGTRSTGMLGISGGVLGGSGAVGGGDGILANGGMNGPGKPDSLMISDADKGRFSIGAPQLTREGFQWAHPNRLEIFS